MDTSSVNEFAGLRERMEQFIGQANYHLNHKTGAIRGVVQGYQLEMESLQAASSQLVAKLEQVTAEQESLRQQIAALESGTDDAKTQLTMYRVRKEQTKRDQAVLVEESKELDKLLAVREQEISQCKERLLQQTQRDNPEVRLYERLLGLSIDTSLVGQLKFTFSNLESDVVGSSSAFLVLDVASDLYRVLVTQPKLSQDKINQLTISLNQSNDIPTFLISARHHLNSQLP